MLSHPVADVIAMHGDIYEPPKRRRCRAKRTAAKLRQIAVWPLEIASECAEVITMCIRMTCDICDCDDHPNQVCPTCVNCIGHHTTEADYDHVHAEYVDRDGVTQVIDYDDHVEEEVIEQCTAAPRTKPHYRYNGATGEITQVDAVQSSTTGDADVDIIAEAFGL